jgi:hypothetical protein
MISRRGHFSICGDHGFGQRINFEHEPGPAKVR